MGVNTRYRRPPYRVTPRLTVLIPSTRSDQHIHEAMQSHRKSRSAGGAALKVGKLALGFLQDFSDGLPFPAKGVINAVQRIVTITEVRLSQNPLEFDVPIECLLARRSSLIVRTVKSLTIVYHS